MTAQDEYYDKAGEAFGNDGGNDGSQGAQVDARALELEFALLDIAGLRDRPPPLPLIGEYLFKDSLAWLSGKPGHGKSFVAAEIACCVATGTPWHSHKVEQGRVLYVLAEGASGFAQRIDAWTMENGAVPDEIRFLPVAVQMGQNVDIAAFAQIIAAVRPVLVIIDTQARVTVGMEENSNPDMGKFVDALERLRLASAGACFLIVHHEPRNGDNLRGAITLEAAATSIMRTVKDGDEVTVLTAKQKDTVEAEPLTLAVEPRGDSVVLVRAGSSTRRTTLNAEKVFDVLNDVFAGQWVSGTKLVDTLVDDMARPTVYKQVRVLVNRGRVQEQQLGNSTRYRVTPEDDA